MPTSRRNSTTVLRNRFRDVFVAEVGLKRARATRLANRCVELVNECNTPSPDVAADKRAQALPAPGTPFDPYIFGAVAVLMREGRHRLLARLEEITTIEELRLLAHAQNLAVPPNVSRLGEMRLALVESAERRIAHRRASAS
jgi:hypothetical protein